MDDFKCCKVCNQEKSLVQFGKNGRGGINSSCRSCKTIKDKIYQNMNKLKIKEHKKKVYASLTNEQKQIIIDKAAIWRKKNPEKAKECVKNSVRKKRKEYTSKNNQYIKQRKQKDPIFKMRYIFGNRIKDFLKRFGKTRKLKFSKYIGCTVDEFKIYLESKFQPGMTWDNYGYKGWHVDHIIPISSAKTEDEIYKLSHYTNLQPLWAVDNFRKGAKCVS